MELTEADDRFLLGPSTIPGAGTGLFAKVSLEPGDQLEVIGVLIPAETESDRCTAYADRYKFRVGDRLLIPVGFGALLNHSNTPNMEKVIEGDRVYLRAISRVSAGEELTFRYSQFAQDQISCLEPAKPAP